MKRRNSARFGRKFEILCSFVQYITSETGDAILHTLRTISWPTPALSTRSAELRALLALIAAQMVPKRRRLSLKSPRRRRL